MKLKLVVVQIFICSIVISQSFSDVLRISDNGLGSSAYSLGLGNASLTLDGDFNAFQFNPATLGLMKNTQLSFGLNYNVFDNETNYFGNSVKNNSSSTSFNNFAYAYKFKTTRGSMVMALAYNRIHDYNRTFKFSGYNSGNNSLIQELTFNNDDMIFDLGLSYPIFDQNNNYMYDTTKIDGRLNESGVTYQDGYKDHLTFSASMEVAKNVFFGVNLNRVSGKINSDREYYEEDLKNIYGENVLLDPDDPRTSGFNHFMINDILNSKFNGFDIKLGFLVKLLGSINLAGTVKFPVNYTIEENYRLSGFSSFSSNNSFEINPVYEDFIKYRIKTPFEFSAGASLKLLIVKAAASVKFIDYSQMSFVDGLQTEAISQNNKLIKENFGQSLEVNLGTEVKIPFLDIRGRAGVIYKTSPYVGDNTDFDKKYITLGLGLFNDSSFSIDLAYALGWWDDISSNYSTSEQNVLHHNQVHNFMLTTRMAIGN